MKDADMQRAKAATNAFEYEFDALRHARVGQRATLVEMLPYPKKA